MSDLKIYNSLNSQFAKISEIVHSIKKKEGNCIVKLKQWFLATESLLKSFNYQESFEIAGFRGQLIATEFATNAVYGNSEVSNASILELIEPAKETMINIISPIEDRIRDCEQIIKELLEEELELNHYAWNKGLEYRDFILAVWRTLLKQENTSKRAKRIKTLLEEEDILRLISNQIKLNKTE